MLSEQSHPPARAGHMTTMSNLLELNAAARAVIERIDDRGARRALIVGGTVRDALVAESTASTIESKDIDIEAHGYRSYAELATALDGLGRLDFRGQAFGVLALTIDGQDFDISLPRRDSQTGVGHRGFTVEVDPGMSEAEAFARRDFTINAIGYRPTTGELIDHHGGVRDLHQRVLKPTSASFAEDPLRVLRGAQLISRLDLHPHQDLIREARKISPRFAELSTERVWGEWRKLARRGTHIGRAVEFLEAAGWLGHFGDLAPLRGTPQDPTWHPEGDVLTHSLLAADHAAARAESDRLEGNRRELVVLAALLHDIGKPTTTRETDGGRIISHEHAEVGASLARQWLLNVGGPADLADNVAVIVAEHMAHTSLGNTPTPAAARRLVRRLGRVSIHDWALVVDADLGGRGIGSRPSPAEAWVKMAETVGPEPRPALLRGEHLRDLGYAPGPGWAELIRASLEAQDDGEFDDEEGARAWAARHTPTGYPARPTGEQLRQIRRWHSAATLPQNPTRPRVPAGVPTGGEWTARVRPEGDARLS